VVNDLGSKHWKYQRYSALVLAPVILWLLVRIIFRPELSYVEVKQWLTLPASSLLLALTIGVLCFHAAIGIQVILEDYVSSDRLQKQLVNLARWVAVLMSGCAVCTILFMWTQ
jgi:succinate dehydrogenase / fumarate reductase membrane anchor subunit